MFRRRVAWLSPLAAFAMIVCLVMGQVLAVAQESPGTPGVHQVVPPGEVQSPTAPVATDPPGNAGGMDDPAPDNAEPDAPIQALAASGTLVVDCSGRGTLTYRDLGASDYPATIEIRTYLDGTYRREASTGVAAIEPSGVVSLRLNLHDIPGNPFIFSTLRVEALLSSTRIAETEVTGCVQPTPTSIPPWVRFSLDSHQCLGGQSHIQYSYLIQTPHESATLSITRESTGEILGSTTLDLTTGPGETETRWEWIDIPYTRVVTGEMVNATAIVTFPDARPDLVLNLNTPCPDTPVEPTVPPTPTNTPPPPTAPPANTVIVDCDGAGAYAWTGLEPGTFVNVQVSLDGIVNTIKSFSLRLDDADGSSHFDIDLTTIRGNPLYFSTLGLKVLGPGAVLLAETEASGCVQPTPTPVPPRLQFSLDYHQCLGDRSVIEYSSFIQTPVEQATLTLTGAGSGVVATTTLAIAAGPSETGYRYERVEVPFTTTVTNEWLEAAVVITFAGDTPDIVMSLGTMCPESPVPPTIPPTATSTPIPPTAPPDNTVVIDCNGAGAYAWTGLEPNTILEVQVYLDGNEYPMKHFGFRANDASGSRQFRIDLTTIRGYPLYFSTLGVKVYGPGSVLLAESAAIGCVQPTPTPIPPRQSLEIQTTRCQWGEGAWVDYSHALQIPVAAPRIVLTDQGTGQVIGETWLNALAGGGTGSAWIPFPPGVAPGMVMPTLFADLGTGDGETAVATGSGVCPDPSEPGYEPPSWLGQTVQAAGFTCFGDGFVTYQGVQPGSIMEVRLQHLGAAPRTEVATVSSGTMYFQFDLSQVPGLSGFGFTFLVDGIQMYGGAASSCDLVQLPPPVPESQILRVMTFACIPDEGMRLGYQHSLSLDVASAGVDVVSGDSGAEVGSAGIPASKGMGSGSIFVSFDESPGDSPLVLRPSLELDDGTEVEIAPVASGTCGAAQPGTEAPDPTGDAQGTEPMATENPASTIPQFTELPGTVPPTTDRTAPTSAPLTDDAGEEPTMQVLTHLPNTGDRQHQTVDRFAEVLLYATVAALLLALAGSIVRHSRASRHK